MDLSNYLLISDLDGTLFDDQKRVPEANIKAIKAYEAEGGLFSIATGRTCASSRRHVNALEVNQPVILFNGSVLYDFAAEQAIWAQPMASSYVQIVQQIAKEHPEVGVEVLCVDRSYTYHMNELIYRHLTSQQVEHSPIGEDEFPNDAIKVFFGVPEDRIDRFTKELQGWNLPEFEFIKTERTHSEMLSRGFNKGYALKRWMASDLLNGKFVVAIGDYYNDVEMLQAADLGVAVENALEPVKELADLVVCSNNEGAIAATIAYIREHDPASK